MPLTLSRSLVSSVSLSPLLSSLSSSSTASTDTSHLSMSHKGAYMTVLHSCGSRKRMQVVFMATITSRPPSSVSSTPSLKEQPYKGREEA